MSCNVGRSLRHKWIKETDWLRKAKERRSMDCGGACLEKPTCGQWTSGVIMTKYSQSSQSHFTIVNQKRIERSRVIAPIWRTRSQRIKLNKETCVSLRDNSRRFCLSSQSTVSDYDKLIRQRK